MIPRGCKDLCICKLYCLPGVLCNHTEMRYAFRCKMCVFSLQRAHVHLQHAPVHLEHPSLRFDSNPFSQVMLTYTHTHAGTGRQYH
jgi:hypothetical protein